MDQRSRLQRVIGSLSAQMSGGNAAKLGVDERQQFPDRRCVTLAPTIQERGNGAFGYSTHLTFLEHTPVQGRNSRAFRFCPDPVTQLASKIRVLQ
jgi:hypothetical protein